MYKLDIPNKSEYATLLTIWEASVRATHHFLERDDIEFFKKTILENDLFDHVNLTCVRDTQGEILGFMGVSNNNLEMLFVGASFTRQGIGKQLLLHAIRNLKITKVDVNEQNEQAYQFYTHFGFKATARSEVDGTGKPYPILHMQLQ